MGIESYSTTPGNNNSASPNGAPEGMSPSGVNDTIRQIMADLRTYIQTAEWFNWGDTIAYASTTSFTVTGDVTTRYLTSRRVKAVGSTTGTIYGTITSTSYSAPDTTVNVLWDSGTLQSEALTISLSISDPSNRSLDEQIMPTFTKSSAYTATRTDHGRLIEVTGGTTITLTAASTVGAGYRVTLRNSGTSVVTVTPAGADTIDGATTYAILAGGSVTLTVNQATNGYLTQGNNQLTKYKTVDTSRASTTTISADPHLTGFALAPDTVYKISGVMVISADAVAMAIKYGLATDVAPQSGEFITVTIGTSPETSTPSAQTAPQATDVYGFIHTHATSITTCELQWAQGISDANNINLHKGSWITFEPMGIA